MKTYTFIRELETEIEIEAPNLAGAAVKFLDEMGWVIVASEDGKGEPDPCCCDDQDGGPYCMNCGGYRGDEAYYHSVDKRLRELTEAVQEMHMADSAHGTGFYSSDRWQKAYQRTMRLITPDKP